MKIAIDAYKGTFEFKEEDNRVGSFDYAVKGLKNESWEKDTFFVIDRLQNKDSTFLDIGAWIGPMSMYAAPLFKKVVSIEPDIKANKCFKKNTKKFNNVSLVEKAFVSEEFKNSHKKIYFGAHENETFEMLGNSKSQSRIVRQKPEDYEVDLISAKDCFEKYNNIALVKCDIEGGEEKVIPDLFLKCNVFKSHLWLSFHFDWWEDKRIERFSDYFFIAKRMHVFNGKLWYCRPPNSVIPIVKEYPFISILFEF